MSEKKDVEGLVEFNGRQVYPEVAEYFRTYHQADRDYHRATMRAHAQHDAAYRELRWQAEDEGRQFDHYSGPDVRRVQEINRVRDEAYAAAQAALDSTSSARSLLLESPHPEVAWIAREALFNDQGSEIEGHARTILKMLPAEPEELYEAAKNDHGMCDVFDRFYDRADSAGVIHGKFPGARERAALRNYIRRNYGSTYIPPLMRQIDPIIKAVTADTEQRLIEAKAEWQRLDEAYAENTHRNRSEGARRAAETRRRNAEERSVVPVQEISEVPDEAPQSVIEPGKVESDGIRTFA